MGIQVPDEDNEMPLSMRARTEGYLYGEFCPVGSERPQLPPASHGPNIGSGGVLGPKRGVRLAKSLGNQILDRGPGQTAWRVSKQPFGVLVGVRDRTVPPDDQEGLGDGLENRQR